MSKLFSGALRIATVAVIGGLVVVEGQRTGWPPKLYALVLVGIAVASLATTLPILVKDVMVGRSRSRQGFRDPRGSEIVSG